jgi:hypothetical protein
MVVIFIIRKDMYCSRMGIPIIIRPIQDPLYQLEMECMSIIMIFILQKTMDIDTILEVLTSQLQVINRKNSKFSNTTANQPNFG